MAVESTTAMLVELSNKYPNLNSLNLAGNGLVTLSGIERFSRLTRLNVDNNNVLVLEGLSNLVELKEVTANENNIVDVHLTCAYAPCLETLSLRNNQLKWGTWVEVLQTLPRLKHVDLTGNPVCLMKGYPNIILEVLTTLDTLDGQSLGAINQMYVEPNQGLLMGQTVNSQNGDFLSKEQIAHFKAEVFEAQELMQLLESRCSQQRLEIESATQRIEVLEQQLAQECQTASELRTAVRARDEQLMGILRSVLQLQSSFDASLAGLDAAAARLVERSAQISTMGNTMSQIVSFREQSQHGAFQMEPDARVLQKEMLARARHASAGLSSHLAALITMDKPVSRARAAASAAPYMNASSQQWPLTSDPRVGHSHSQKAEMLGAGVEGSNRYPHAPEPPATTEPEVQSQAVELAQMFQAACAMLERRAASLESRAGLALQALDFRMQDLTDQVLQAQRLVRAVNQSKHKQQNPAEHKPVSGGIGSSQTRAQGSGTLEHARMSAATTAPEYVQAHYDVHRSDGSWFGSTSEVPQAASQLRSGMEESGSKILHDGGTDRALVTQARTSRNKLPESGHAQTAGDLSIRQVYSTHELQEERFLARAEHAQSLGGPFMLQSRGAQEDLQQHASSEATASLKASEDRVQSRHADEVNRLESQVEKLERQLAGARAEVLRVSARAEQESHALKQQLEQQQRLAAAAQREAAKAGVLTRQLQRQIAQENEDRLSADSLRIQELERLLSARESELSSLRRERNSLLSMMRRSGVVPPTSAGSRSLRSAVPIPSPVSDDDGVLKKGFKEDGEPEGQSSHDKVVVQPGRLGKDNQIKGSTALRQSGGKVVNALESQGGNARKGVTWSRNGNVKLSSPLSYSSSEDSQVAYNSINRKQQGRSDPKARQSEAESARKQKTLVKGNVTKPTGAHPSVIPPNLKAASIELDQKRVEKGMYVGCETSSEDEASEAFVREEAAQKQQYKSNKPQEYVKVMQDLGSSDRQARDQYSHPNRAHAASPEQRPMSATTYPLEHSHSSERLNMEERKGQWEGRDRVTELIELLAPLAGKELTLAKLLETSKPEVQPPKPQIRVESNVLPESFVEQKVSHKTLAFGKSNAETRDETQSGGFGARTQMGDVSASALLNTLADEVLGLQMQKGVGGGWMSEVDALELLSEALLAD